MPSPTVQRIREMTLTVDRYSDAAVARAYEVVKRYIYNYSTFDTDYPSSAVMHVEVAAIARALDEWAEEMSQPRQARLF